MAQVRFSPSTSSLRTCKRAIASGIALASAVLSTSVQAQLEEVVVTAQKRDQNAQDVPIAIATLTESTIRDAGIITIDQAIPLLPGVTGTTSGIATSFWAIRGVSTTDFSIGSEPSVAVYLDEGYIGRNIHATGVLFDLQAVEALKGPQGTLFGRNAAAGAISMRSQAPKAETSLHLGLGIGDEGQRRYEVTGNLAVSDTVALRLAYLGDRFDGLWKNIVTGNNLYRDGDSLRLSAAFDPSDSFNLIARINYGDQESNANLLYNPALSANAPGVEFPDRVENTTAAKETLENFGANVTMRWDLSPSLSLTSITDYRDAEFSFDQDIDASNANALIDAGLGGVTGGLSLAYRQPYVEGESFSQEFRLSGSTDRMDWFLGVNYFTEDLKESQRVEILNTVDLAPVLNPGDLLLADETLPSGDNTSLGFYGDVRWRLSDALAVTAGARWSKDEKDFCSQGTAGVGLVAVNTDGPICDSEDWSEVTPRLVVDYQLQDDVMLYASVARGYKAGGFNPAATDVDGDFFGDQLSPFDPETNLTYEVGAKTEWLDRRLRFNAALFQSDYEDIQIQTATIAGIIITNAAEADIVGGEAELTYQANENLTFRANYAHVDTEYGGRADLEGNNLIYAPENTFSASFDYRVALGSGELALYGLYTYQSAFFNTPDNSTALEEPSYGLFSARVAYAPVDGGWEIAVRGDNLADEDFGLVRQDIGLGTGPQLNRGLGRRVMLMLSLNF